MKDIFSTNNAGKMDVYITKIWAYAETWDLLQKLTPNMLQKGNKESMLKEKETVRKSSNGQNWSHFEQYIKQQKYWIVTHRIK